MPSEVESAYASWLKSPTLFAAATPSGVPAAIVATGQTSEVQSPLVDLFGANLEAARQLAVLGGGRPLAMDRHLVSGQRADLLGRVVTLRSEMYAAGLADCLVVSVDEQDDNTTELAVIVALTGAAYAPTPAPQEFPSLDNVFANSDIVFANETGFREMFASLEAQLEALGVPDGED